MARAISMTIGSVAGSSLTTIAGFVALCFMSFTLGMDLGIVMAKGVVLGVICTVTVLPALILVCDKPIQKTTHRAFNLNGEKISNFVVRHNKVFLVVILLLWIPAIFGYNRVQVYYNLDSSLPDYLPSVQANQKLTETFDMSTIHIILADEDLEAKDVKSMLSEIEDLDGVSFALSEDSLIGSRIPKDFLPESATEELASGGRQLMIIGSQYKVATDEANAQVDQLNEILKRYDPEGLLIGEAPCTKDLITITDHDFAVVSAVSIVLIFLIILLVLRSVSLPIILVLVIELAIYINMSISYYTGAVLPFIASIVIGTIQLGATVDYAILMTNRYEHERMSGKDKVEATKAALASSIPSIVTSALGFFAATIGVGIYSDVDLIGSLCLLMARGALISMAVVILLLPSLYLLCDKLILKTSWGLRAKKHKLTEQET
jgi:predicted RND superfamily exporter protein